MRELAKDLNFLSGTFATAQQTRLDIGHALFGARVNHGAPSSSLSRRALGIADYAFVLAATANAILQLFTSDLTDQA